MGVAVAVVVIVLAAGLLAGIELGRTVFNPSNSTKSHYLVVGTNIPFPPFEDYNYSSGAYFGFDIDFAQLIANATGRTLVVQNYADFSVLLTDTGAGVVDMAASAITSSGLAGHARNMTMSFSNPYYDANQAVLVSSSSTLSCVKNNCTVANLKGLQVGIQTGTTSQSWVAQYLAPNETNGWADIHNYTTVDTEITALNLHSLDAVIIDAGPAASIAAASGGGLKVAGLIITNELYSFAVAHGDPEGLLPTINSVISSAMSSGLYAKEIKKWFG